MEFCLRAVSHTGVLKRCLRPSKQYSFFIFCTKCCFVRNVLLSPEIRQKTKKKDTVYIPKISQARKYPLGGKARLKAIVSQDRCGQVWIG